MPKISVIVPSYNAAATLQESIESLQKQDHNSFEIIIVDDGSTDDSRLIAERLADTDARISVLPTSHQGIIHAIATGIEESNGTLIARMDADDIAHPTRLSQQAKRFDTQPDLALCGTKVESFGDNVGPGRVRYDQWVNSLLDSEALQRELFVECPIPHPTFMIRRDALESIGGYAHTPWPEDYELILRLIAAGHRLDKVNDTLLQWRHTPDRLSETDTRYSPEQFRSLKRHYLPKLYPQIARGFYQWGAGVVGKAWLREWDEQRPVKVVDLHPRKIGRTIHHVEVIKPEDLPDPGQTITLVAVGAPGARQEIREWFQERGYTETKDFVFLA